MEKDGNIVIGDFVETMRGEYIKSSAIDTFFVQPTVDNTWQVGACIGQRAYQLQIHNNKAAAFAAMEVLIQNLYVKEMDGK